MSILQFEDSTTLSIESQIQRLALEANVLNNVIDTFRNFLPNITAKIKDLSFTKSDTNYSDIIRSTVHINNKIKNKIKYVNFIDYNKTLISVPEDFVGDLLEYLVLLNKLSPEVYGEANSILSEYSSMLSLFITDKESKISVHDETRFFNNITKRREDFGNQIGKFFPTNTGKSKKYLGDIINRFSDLDTIVNEVSKLDKNHIAQNMENTSKGVDKCVDLLNIVIKEINAGNINNVSGATSMNLATGAYEIAKYVEFISIFRFKTEQALVSVQKLVETLDKII